MTTTNSSQSRSKIISSINNSPTVYLNKQAQIKSSSSLQNYNENNVESLIKIFFDTKIKIIF